MWRKEREGEEVERNGEKVRRKGMQGEKRNKAEVRGVKGGGAWPNRGEQGEVYPTLMGGGAALNGGRRTEEEMRKFKYHPKTSLKNTKV